MVEYHIFQEIKPNTNSQALWNILATYRYTLILKAFLKVVSGFLKLNLASKYSNVCCGMHGSFFKPRKRYNSRGRWAINGGHPDNCLIKMPIWFYCTFSPCSWWSSRRLFCTAPQRTKSNHKVVHGVGVVHHTTIVDHLRVRPACTEHVTDNVVGCDGVQPEMSESTYIAYIPC